jgi:hypothetical protein
MSWKANIRSASQETFCIDGTPMLITTFKITWQWTLSWARYIQWCIITILPSTSRFLKLVLSSYIFWQTGVQIINASDEWCIAKHITKQTLLIYLKIDRKWIDFTTFKDLFCLNYLTNWRHANGITILDIITLLFILVSSSLYFDRVSFL